MKPDENYLDPVSSTVERYYLVFTLMQMNVKIWWYIYGLDTKHDQEE